METAILSTVVAAVLIFAVVLYRSLAGAQAPTAFSVEQFGECSTKKYRPMLHLLAEGEAEFLRRQPGYTEVIGRKFRRDRRRIFRQYLRMLSREFNRTHAAARIVAVHSAEDHPNLVRELLVQQLRFNWGLLCIEFRLILHWMGIGSVQVDRLIDALDTAQMQVRQMMLLPQVQLDA